MSLCLRVVCLLILGTAANAQSLEQNAAELSFRVTNVTSFFAADKAGLKAGDELVGWSHASTDSTQSEAYTFTSPFALLLLERETHLVNPVILHVRRESDELRIAPGDGRWRMTGIPILPDGLDAELEVIGASLEDNDFDAAVKNTEALARQLQQQNEILLSTWVLYKTASSLGPNSQWRLSGDVYQSAIDTLDTGEFAQERALLLYYRSGVLLRQDRLDEADEDYRSALQLEESISADRYGIAANLTGLANTARRRGNLPRALDLLHQSLQVLERIAPGSMIIAATLNRRGSTAVAAGDIDGAEQDFSRALAIADNKDPGGVAAAGYVNSLAIVHYFRGDLASAERMFAQALSGKSALEPDSLNVASALHNVGLMNLERGHLREAESYYLKALAILEKIVPGTLETTQTLNNLGSLSLSQGDLQKAERYHNQALELRQKLVPNSPDHIASLVNLGSVARYRGDLERAEELFMDALEIQEVIATESKEYANILQNLGAVAVASGNTANARDYFEQSRLINNAAAPAGPGVAEAHSRLGWLALEEGDVDVAAEELAPALAILTRIAPNTYREARVLHGLAKISQQKNAYDDARQYYEKALGALESQHARIGGTQESKAESRARQQGTYQDYIDFLLEIDDAERAFEILERSRAKVLSDSLRERDLVFDADLPEELEREQRVLAYSYDKTQGELYRANDAEEIDKLQTKLDDIRRQQRDVASQIRERSPQLADLQESTPLSLGEVRASVDSGTAILSYSVNELNTHIFLLAADSTLHVRTLPFGRAEFERRVEQFRFLIDAGRWDEVPADPLNKVAQDLYETLLRPVEQGIEGATRLLIVPDGPLRVLPFAALRRGDVESQYLIEWMPFQIASSLGVRAQLARNRGVSGNGSLVAFGNPDYRHARRRVSSADGSRSNGDDNDGLSALPWSAEEVSNIASLNTDRATVYVGGEATEEKVKAIASTTDYVHFATHTITDERNPLDTAIVLSIPEEGDSAGENGYLQVWEIYEGLRINADLVTLSGCETALGSEYPGEGLMGLTRAFQYAGASSVLASLWNVDDRSTSRLMTEFYRYLAQGESKEDALRMAQTAMIRSVADSHSWLQTIRNWFTDTPIEASDSHPYHWAGFVLH